ncbi:sigma-70 family RNA polymerase sigma factor [Amycolatopsis sp. GM8]|uniref:sigma-70 family RNA polymerase sigma factor n=1 Tax=Amycolatopsis sp. GM8 TaxID=2896530 RepID=UPI001F20588D|nr:sigma-70 family RNA polymerase sigma factor [Amycolatopsis sp. GM8]
MTHAVRDTGDSVLLEAVRGGDQEAFAELFRRHAEAAGRLAWRWAGGGVEQQELVAEAFARVLAALRGGGGPKENLLPYLLVTMRHVANDRWRRERRVELYGTAPGEDDVRDAVVARPDDVALRHCDAGLASVAFSGLPPRWRTVLWHAEVERRVPAELASRLGISPNAVASLAVRAREGLRQAYLQAQVPDARALDCRAPRLQLGAWIRGALPARRAGVITSHLAGCADCRTVAAGVLDANGGLCSPVLGDPGARSRGQDGRTWSGRRSTVLEGADR